MGTVLLHILFGVLNIQKNANYYNKIIKTQACIHKQTHMDLYIVELYCYLITTSDGANNLKLCLLEYFKYICTKKLHTKNLAIGPKTSMPQNA